MNVFQIQENLRTAPDDYLVKEMQQPTGMAPQYLVLTELQRRQQLRQGVGAQMPTTTVAQDLAAGIGGGMQPEIPNAANQPQPPSMAAMQGSTAPQKSSFASGGMVGEEKEGFFDGLNPLMGGLVPWALDKMGGDDGWQLGAVGLMSQLFGDKKKEQLPGQVPANPMDQQPMQRFAGGGQPQDPQQASMWRNLTGMEIPEWLKRRIQFEVEKEKPSEQPDLRGPVNENSRLLRRIRGPESQGGKDQNSIASNGKYLGPNQMYAGSYKDGRDAYLRMHPDANIPKWDPAWEGSKEGKRPKGYPTKEQWDMVGEGYVQVNRDFNKSIGAPETDGNIYGNFNVGMGNFKKLFKNPDTPIKDLLPREVIEQNRFNPNHTFTDMSQEWGRRLDKFSGPAQKDVQQTPSKKFFYVPEGEDPSMSENDMINDMFSADDPDQAILDKIRMSAEQASANKEAAALTGIAKMLEGSPMIPPQAPPMPRPKPAPQRMVAPQDQKTAEDILNDMQYRAAQNQRIRKQRLGYADGGQVDSTAYYLEMINKNRKAMGLPPLKNLDGATAKEMAAELEANAKIADKQSGDFFGYESDKKSRAGRFFDEAAHASAGLVPLTASVASRGMALPVNAYDYLFGDSPRGGTPPAVQPVKPAPAKPTPAKVAAPGGLPSLMSPPSSDMSVSIGGSARSGNPSGGIGGLAEYMKQIQGLRGEPKEDPRMEALYASMKRNPELDKWMAIADFGGKLASGSSPYFAQNFGPATTAGIASYRGSEEAARENAMKEANSRLLQRQNDDANYRTELGSAVDMYQADKRYQQAIDSISSRYSEALKKQAGGRAVSIKAVADLLKERGMANELMTMGLKPGTQEYKKAMADIYNEVVNMVSAAGLQEDSKYGGSSEGGAFLTADE